MVIYARHAPVIQIMISQVIIGYRTWAITRRSKNLGVLLLGFGFIVTALEWYANVDGRIPVQEEVSLSFEPNSGDQPLTESILSVGKVRHSFTPASKPSGVT
jgi:hypothetical protein